MEPIRAYRYYRLSESGELEGFARFKWTAGHLTANCWHEQPLVDCTCGIYGLYSPQLGVQPFQDYAILTSCLFYGRTVIGSEGVRAMEADIEWMWLISDLLNSAYGNILSDETKARVFQDVAYHLSAKYGVRVSVTTSEEVKALPVQEPPRAIPEKCLVGRYQPGTKYRWLTVKPNSRLARSLAYAMGKEDGIVTAAELRGLHCKEWKDCIHGVTGWASFTELSIKFYGLFERVKRGNYKISERGIELMTKGRVKVAERYSNYTTLHGQVFVPIGGDKAEQWT